MSTLIQFDRELRKLFQNPFSNDFGRLFNLQINQEPSEKNRDYSVFRHNEKGNWNIELPFPGLTQEDIQVKVDLENRQLTVIGQKSEQSSKQDESVTYTKRAELNRQYSFYMDEKFNLESITAQCVNGILKIELQENEPQEKPNKMLNIAVQGAS